MKKKIVSKINQNKENFDLVVQTEQDRKTSAAVAIESNNIIDSVDDVDDEKKK